jgi:hypothetical protein
VGKAALGTARVATDEPKKRRVPTLSKFAARIYAAM